MKKIIGVEIENFKAYADKYSIRNDEGKNLLIYGENGSGKSSLYTALDLFFKNSLKPQNFEKNIFNEGGDGAIQLLFADFLDGKIVDDSKESFSFSSGTSDNHVVFIQENALIKGFIDYTDLLQFYLKSDPDPNLFSLIILHLLGNYIPLSSGSTSPINKTFNELTEDLLLKPWTRRDRLHRNAVSKISLFDRELRDQLNKIFAEANKLLDEYFQYSDIEIQYLLEPLRVEYGSGGKKSWSIKTDLRLHLRKNSLPLGKDYKEKLNEARLASIAICVFLASLIHYPKKVDLKVLYLDDIFVGLDSSNRLPILQILIDHFADFQIFISTYDKTFFHLAKLKLGSADWSFLEFYVGSSEYGGSQIETPIISRSKTDFEKAQYYLYSKLPDYPASANYYRKSIESLLQKNFPSFLFKDGNFENIETYRLTKLFDLSLNFLRDLDIEVKELEDLKDYIYILLHPLSHYQIDAAEYKIDLLKIDSILKRLLDILPSLKLRDRITFILEKNSHLKLEFFGHAYHKHIYEFKNLEPLIYDRDTKKFSDCHLLCKKMYNELADGTFDNSFSPNKNSNVANYFSLEDAFSKISEYLVCDEEPTLVSKMPFIKHFKVLKGIRWVEII